jgi:hypothetical protein
MVLTSRPPAEDHCSRRHRRSNSNSNGGAGGAQQDQ